MNSFKTNLLCLLIIVAAIISSNKVSDNIAKILTKDYNSKITINNNYSKNKSYNFFKLSKNNYPLSYKELIGEFFKAIDSKSSKYTFYCPSEYKNCLNDVTKISDNELLLTHLNNFVHPYNSFTNIKTKINESGEITLSITYLYQDEEIEKINEKANEIINNTINDSMTDYDKIKAIHDYLAKNIKYDVERNETGNSKYDSYKATGALFSGYATCNGYADTLAIFLSILGFDNFKIATAPEEISYESTGHVWNAIYYENSWRHIDLTWDDPVGKDGKEYLYHKYFLVTNDELNEADQGEVKIEEHNFNKLIYSELK